MTGVQPFWRDPLFYLALAAAVIFWVLLYLLTQPEVNLGWIFDQPSRLLFAVLLYPVAEELVFRGLVQDLMHRHLPAWHAGPVSHANLLTSLLFSAMHFINHPPVWAAAVLVPSLVFGFFKDRTGTLGAPIALHVFYNGGYFLVFTH